MTANTVYVLMAHPDITEGKGWFWPEAVIAEQEENPPRHHFKPCPVFTTRAEFEDYSKGKELFRNLPKDRQKILAAENGKTVAESGQSGTGLTLKTGDTLYLYLKSTTSGGYVYPSLHAVFANRDATPSLNDGDKLMEMPLYPSLSEYWGAQEKRASFPPEQALPPEDRRAMQFFLKNQPA